MKKIIFLLIIIAGVWYLGRGGSAPIQCFEWYTDGGNCYQIVQTGFLKFTNTGQNMFTVRFISEDPSDEKIREKEFSDIFRIVSRHVNLDGYDSVGLEAVKITPTSSYTSSTNGYRTNMDAAKVKELKNTAGEAFEHEMWTEKGGKSYEVIRAGNFRYTGAPQKFFSVRYFSENPESASVRNAEFRDLYLMIPGKINTGDYDKIMLEAVKLNLTDSSQPPLKEYRAVMDCRRLENMMIDYNKDSDKNLIQISDEN